MWEVRKIGSEVAGGVFLAYWLSNSQIVIAIIRQWIRRTIWNVDGVMWVKMSFGIFLF